MAKKKNVPPTLTRRRAWIEPRLKLLIVCEGGNTEPNYFTEFADHFGNNLVRIRYEAGAGVPKTIVDKAVSIKNEYKKNKIDSFEKNDEIWSVFDIDTHPNISDALRKARANGIKIAYSNPCFELWAVLHYTMQDAPVSSLEIQRVLSKKMQKYNRKGSKLFDYSSMSKYYSEAKSRALVILSNREKEGSPGGNPSTNIFELTELIIQNGRPCFNRKINNTQ